MALIPQLGLVRTPTLVLVAVLCLPVVLWSQACNPFDITPGIDCDNDGIDNATERANGTDPDDVCDPNPFGPFCDADQDGVLNRNDIDDDNDGIPDALEGCPDCLAGPFINGQFDLPGFPGVNGFGLFNEIQVPGWETTATDNLIEIWQSGHSGIASQSSGYHAELNANRESALFQSVCAPPGTVFDWSVWHRGRRGTDVAEVNIGADIASAQTVATMTTGLAWANYTGTYTVPAGQVQTLFAFGAVSTAGGNISVGNLIDNVEITITSLGTCPDTDDDGTPDAFDTDSDDDGCPDAIEGGGAFELDDLDDNNMLSGGVGANGLPTAAGSTGQTRGDSIDGVIQEPAGPCCDPEEHTDLTLSLHGPICIDGCEGTPTSASFFVEISSIKDGMPQAPAGMPVMVYGGDPFAGAATLLDQFVTPQAVPAGQSIRFPVQVNITGATLPTDICLVANVLQANAATTPLDENTNFPAADPNGVKECDYTNNAGCIELVCPPATLFAP